MDPHTAADTLRRTLAEKDVVIAEQDGRRVGYLRLERLWSRLPFIALITVDAVCRRRGVGRAMLAFLEDRLARDGHAVIYSSSQSNEPEPQRWHRHMGFSGCGRIRGINPDGSDEVFFRKAVGEAHDTRRGFRGRAERCRRAGAAAGR